MSNELSVSREPRARKVDLRLLQRATKRALTLLDVDYVLGIRVIGSREMTRANEAYLSHTGPTDVITFHYQKAAMHPSGADSQDKKQVYGEYPDLQRRGGEASGRVSNIGCTRTRPLFRSRRLAPAWIR